MQRVAGRASVGENNVAAAKRWLEHERIAVVAVETGGEFGRRIAFEIPSGAAWVRLLKGSAR
jgi:chemotaxis receptor (MCP) glutamine deamidase CheD